MGSSDMVVFWLSSGLLLGSLLTLPSQAGAQMPAGSGVDATASLPSFTVRQIVTGRNDTLVRIPGPWLQAANSTSPESLAAVAYGKSAVRSGLTPLEGTLLLSERSHRLMGLYRRGELTRAARRTLQSIRDGIRSDSTRARFDRLFRPRGDWVVDLHDAALAWARPRLSPEGWTSAYQVLERSRWIEPDDGVDPAEAMARALYGLSLLAAGDSNALRTVRLTLQRTDPAGADAVWTLLLGYAESRRWFVEAVEFLMTEPWIPDSGGRAIQDYLRDEWQHGSLGQKEPEIRLPRIIPRWFGHPQAVPRYSVPSSLLRRLVVTNNSAARAWLERHGESELLRTLHRLPPGDSAPSFLAAGSATVHLTSIPLRSRQSLNGFLEPVDAIAIDPGYSPLLAPGAVVHEWQHLLFRRRQLEAWAGRRKQPSVGMVEWPGLNPYIAEGFAEWSSERVLAPIVRRWPLLGLAELEKRVGLSRADSADQHFTGHALVSALARTLDDPAATTLLLLRHADDPSGLMADSRLRRAWNRFRSSPDLVIGVAPRMLIPEVTFTIEDGFPDVTATRILVPPGFPAKH